MFVDTSLNQDGYSNNDKSELMTKLALKHGTVLKGDKNEWIPKAKLKCDVTRSIVCLRKLIFEILLS